MSSVGNELAKLRQRLARVENLLAPEAQDGSVEALYDAGYKLLKQIRDYERQAGIDLPPDHACVRCHPDIEMPVEGFLCGRHAMGAVLRSRMQSKSRADAARGVM